MRTNLLTVFMLIPVLNTTAASARQYIEKEELRCKCFPLIYKFETYYNDQLKFDLQMPNLIIEGFPLN